MKTDRAALLWGTIIAVALVAAIIVVTSKFPNFRVPFTDTQAETSLVSAGVFGILVASYRKLWKSIGFWMLLLAFLGAHVALYWFFLLKVTEEVGGFRMDILYGFISGVEFAVFAVIVARLYHRGPDVGFLTRKKAH
jgi:hypothetical protein